jgi:hypothetical protein
MYVIKLKPSSNTDLVSTDAKHGKQAEQRYIVYIGVCVDR